MKSSPMLASCPAYLIFFNLIGLLKSREAEVPADSCSRTAWYQRLEGTTPTPCTCSHESLLRWRHMLIPAKSAQHWDTSCASVWLQQVL
jgi:hypothetical protein